MVNTFYDARESVLPPFLSPSLSLSLSGPLWSPAALVLSFIVSAVTTFALRVMHPKRAGATPSAQIPGKHTPRQ